MAEANNIVAVLKLKINKFRGKKKLATGLPWWSSGWEMPANVGYTGPIPGREDSTCLGAVKPMGHKAMCLERVLHNKRSHSDERPCNTGKSSPLPTAKESLCTATRPSTYNN